MSCCRNKAQGDLTENRIELGRVGEYGARTIKFKLTEFVQFGEGTFMLIHQRSNDFAPYVVESVETEGNELVWTVSATDTACEGVGYAEIHLIRDDVLLAKSEPYMTFVSGALGTPDLPQAYSQVTIDTVTAIAATAKEYMDQAEAYRDEAKTHAEIVVHPPIIGENRHWYLWDGSAYVDSGYSAIGDPGKSAYEYATDGGYSDTEQNFYADLGGLKTIVADAEQAEESSEAHAEDSEAWANGQRNGTNVESDDPAYQNNSKYYKEQAEAAKDDAETAQTASENAQTAAEAARDLSIDAKDDAVTAQTNAETAATAAVGAAGAAALSATDSEAWANGKRNGSDVPSTDEAYQNNSKYYAEQASIQASYTAHPPIISESDTWKIWNGTQYVDTGIDCRGVAGKIISVTASATAGAEGDPAAASVTLGGTDEERTMAFSFTLPRGATGPQGIQGIPGPNEISGTTETELNGVLAGNGSNVVTKDIVESKTLTKAQYDALPAADKAKDILYIITDDDSGADVYSKSQVDTLLTQKQAVINTTGILKGNGSGTVVAATVDSAPNASHTSNLISSAAVANTGIGVAGSTLTAISDANSAVLTGFYSTTSSTTNLPSDLTTTAEKNCMIFTVAKGDYVHQQLYCFDQKRMFFRYRSDSLTWTTWMSSDCNYYNANTNMGDESARKAAIEALYSQMGGLNGSLQHTMAYGVIRYSGGYYVTYLFLGRYVSSAVETVVEILKSNQKEIVVWTINNSTATKGFMLPAKTKIYQNSGETITAAANTFVYTGLSVTIPANSYYAIYGAGSYVSYAGNGAAFSTSTKVSPETATSATKYYAKSYSDNSASTSLCGYTTDALTLYLWCRWNGMAGNHKAYLTGWYEPA